MYEEINFTVIEKHLSECNRSTTILFCLTHHKSIWPLSALNKTLETKHNKLLSLTYTYYSPIVCVKL